MYLDKESNAVLLTQSRILVELAESHATWRASQYGSIIKMSSEQTLKEVRRYWLLYADMESLSPARYQALVTKFKGHCTSVIKQNAFNLGPARSAGPFMPMALELSKDIFCRYWTTGTTFSDKKKIAAATILNPTFVYSRGEDACCVHYGSDPTTPFHLASVYGNAKRSTVATDVIKAAMAEFGAWCAAFQSSVSMPDETPAIRFFWADAMAVYRCLTAFRSTRALESGVPVAQWRTQTIQLSHDEYINSSAPTQFNIIDTSNLVDHIGLLNVIIAAAPLLASPFSVLYTESLTYRGKDATREFKQLLFSDITTFSLLVGLCPVDYLTAFTSRSNSHELIMHENLKGKAPQYHQVTTWRSPSIGDTLRCTRVFNTRQLGTFLYDLYHAVGCHYVVFPRC
jgi:hypothetical protein